MSEQSSGRCGPHTTIAVNDATRVTQCSCGVYHVNLTKKGLTFQVSLEDLRRLSDAIGLSVRVAEAEDRCASLIGDAN